MRRIIVLGALSALGAIGVAAQDPACLANCVSSTGAKFIDFGCVAPNQEGCLCPNQNFQFSVRDCSIQGCQATEDQALDYLFDPAQGFCKSHPRPESSAVPSSTEAPTSTEEPVATTQPTEAATTATEEGASTTETTSAPTSTKSQTTGADEATTTTSDSESSPTENVGAPTASSSGEADGSEGGGGGLSSGAAAGIGVGVAVVVIALAVVVGVIFLRRRRSRLPKDQPVDISRPMPPTAGRAHRPVDHGSFGEKGRGGESIEMHTNRYEDMPPRQTPRIMV